MRQWYALYCRPKQETRAKEHLLRQGYTVYFPKLRVLKQRKAGLVPVIESLFPRYIFICLDEFNDNWAPIRSTRGVVDLVRTAGVPLGVSHQVIQQLQSMQAPGTDYLDRTQDSDYRRGEILHIQRGPFSGLPASFVERNGGDRVVLLLTFMSAAHTVTLPASAVER